MGLGTYFCQAKKERHWRRGVKQYPLCKGPPLGKVVKYFAYIHLCCTQCFSFYDFLCTESDLLGWLRGISYEPVIFMVLRVSARTF